MKNLVSCILDLLRVNQCAIVPGLGAFVQQRLSARLEDSVMMPPMTTVMFNADIRDTDGMLAHGLGKRLGISYQEALTAVSAEVQHWKDILSNVGVLNLDGLGTLTMSHGLIEFTPLACYDFADNYGLKPLYLVERYNAADSLAADAPAEDISTDNSVSTPVTRHAWLHTAAAAVLALMIWSAIPTQVVDMPAVNDMLTTVDWTYLQQKKIDELQAIEDSIARHHEMIQNRTYHLVVASLSPDAAETYMNEMAASGYDNVHLLPAANGQQRVAVDAFDDFKDALAALKTLRGEKRFARAWVLTNRPLR